MILMQNFRGKKPKLIKLAHGLSFCSFEMSFFLFFPHFYIWYFIHNLLRVIMSLLCFSSGWRKPEQGDWQQFCKCLLTPLCQVGWKLGRMEIKWESTRPSLLSSPALLCGAVRTKPSPAWHHLLWTVAVAVPQSQVPAHGSRQCFTPAVFQAPFFSVCSLVVISTSSLCVPSHKCFQFCTILLLHLFYILNPFPPLVNISYIEFGANPLSQCCLYLRLQSWACCF